LDDVACPGIFTFDGNTRAPTVRNEHKRDECAVVEDGLACEVRLLKHHAECELVVVTRPCDGVSYVEVLIELGRLAVDGTLQTQTPIDCKIRQERRDRLRNLNA
jgi:hypothetical protein